jgi:hypothetical protein
MAKTNKLVRQIKLPRNAGIFPVKEQRPKSAALYLLELRSRQNDTHAELPRRKIVISIDHQEGNGGLPHNVKITHT